MRSLFSAGHSSRMCKFFFLLSITKPPDRVFLIIRGREAGVKCVDSPWLIQLPKCLIRAILMVVHARRLLNEFR